MITPADSAPSAPEQMPASSFDIQAPYAAGSAQPIAGAPDEVAGSVAAAVSVAESRNGARQTETYQQGSQIGDAVSLPAQDFSVANAHQAGYTGQGGSQ